jgi:hypothetical protein
MSIKIRCLLISNFFLYGDSVTSINIQYDIMSEVMLQMSNLLKTYNILKNILIALQIYKGDREFQKVNEKFIVCLM